MQATAPSDSLKEDNPLVKTSMFNQRLWEQVILSAFQTHVRVWQLKYFQALGLLCWRKKKKRNLRELGICDMQLSQSYVDNQHPPHPQIWWRSHSYCLLKKEEKNKTKEGKTFVIMSQVTPMIERKQTILCFCWTGKAGTGDLCPFEKVITFELQTHKGRRVMCLQCVLQHHWGWNSTVYRDIKLICLKSLFL